jgi:hypothetical protein
MVTLAPPLYLLVVTRSLSGIITIMCGFRLFGTHRSLIWQMAIFRE